MDASNNSIVFAEVVLLGLYRVGDSIGEEVRLPPGRTYRFTFQDDFGDGIEGSDLHKLPLDPFVREAETKCIPEICFEQDFFCPTCFRIIVVFFNSRFAGGNNPLCFPIFSSSISKPSLHISFNIS
jgi:hypothetical protein